LENDLIKLLSYGGGLDSFAMLLDAIQRGELPNYAVFADTGSPSGRDGEWPGTYEHMKQYAIPLCHKHGIEFVWITKDMYPVRGYESLLAFFEANRMMLTRMSRVCTAAAKVERIQKWMDDTIPASESIEVWIGFEAGEENRAANDPHNSKTCGAVPRRTNRFPLIERQLCRCRCEVMTRQAGYPVPRKSACIVCPFNSKGDWKTAASEQPVTFARAISLEENSKITEKRGIKLRFSGEPEKPLEDWTVETYTPRLIPCLVCGRKRRASKKVGTGFLTPEEYAEA
jgi:hypothetical protein